ncbi:MAG: SlyX family protein [Polyangiaceae bacterium]|nr:SlyX family protein [Polyangiaceae bacterium]
MSQTEQENQERFLTIEMKVAYQEKLLAELNEVVREQGLIIDDLKTRLERTEGGVEALLHEKPGHEKPPHY